jgi:hypothetical protein
MAVVGNFSFFFSLINMRIPRNFWGMCELHMSSNIYLIDMGSFN